VVQDLFMTPTAQLADVVLPAAEWAERDGTYTNAERRVQRFRAARNPHAESRPDWQIFAVLGRAVHARMPQPEPVAAAQTKGKARTYGQPASRPWAYRSTDDVNAAIVREVAIYKDTAYSKLKGATGVWGRQPVEDPVYYDGTSYQNTEGIGVQWPTAAENAQTRFDLQFVAPQALAQRDGDLTLVGAPRLYDGGTLMQNSPGINYWVAQPYVGMARPDAERMGIKSGDKLRISSEVGSIELPALVDGLVQPGAVLIPDLEAAPLGNVQTGVLTPIRIQKIEG
jgi:NADH-quinone oxidoreductase subunit G